MSSKFLSCDSWQKKKKTLSKSTSQTSFMGTCCYGKGVSVGVNHRHKTTSVIEWNFTQHVFLLSVQILISNDHRERRNFSICRNHFFAPKNEVKQFSRIFSRIHLHTWGWLVFLVVDTLGFLSHNRDPRACCSSVVGRCVTSTACYWKSTGLLQIGMRGKNNQLIKLLSPYSDFSILFVWAIIFAGCGPF